MSRHFFCPLASVVCEINGLRLINFSIKIISFTLTSSRSITWTLKILTIWIVPLIKSEHIDRKTNHDKTGLNPRRKTNENYQYLKLGCLQDKKLKPSYITMLEGGEFLTLTLKVANQAQRMPHESSVTLLELGTKPPHFLLCVIHQKSISFSHHTWSNS